jgi:DNA-directed RNA polymerase subunit RPC12/RpoP
MIDESIPECPECKSREVVLHKHNVATLGESGQKYVADFECMECGRQWRPAAELTERDLSGAVQRIRLQSTQRPK